MAEDFSRAVARVVAAQIAESAGFDACQDSAIEILADLLLRYLTTVCASSHSYAELAGRSQSNLADVLLALEELGVTPEDLHHHMQQQGTDIPFAHTLAPYPVHCQRPVAPTFADQKEAPPAHIPAFLPAFPDLHTYQHTAAFSGHEADPYKQRQSMLEAKQKAEAALNKLHQRMSSKKTAQPNSNPFLEPPVVQQLHLQHLQHLQSKQHLMAAAGLSVAVSPGAAGTDEGSNAADHLPHSATRSADVPGAPDAVEKGLAGAVKVEQPTAAEAAAAVASSAAPDLLGLKRLLQQQQQSCAETEEDALFETAAVLRAFSSILPGELLAAAAGGGSNTHQQQQEADGSVEEPMDVDVQEVGAAAAQQPLAAAVGPQGYGTVGWRSSQDVTAPLPAAAGVVGSSSAELLCSGIDPLAAGKRTLFTLSSRQRPADVYAERLQMRVGAGRQRKSSSRSDGDPKVIQAKGILEAGPEAVFAAAGSGSSSLHDVFDIGDGLDG